MTEHLRQGFRLGEFDIYPPAGTIKGPDGARRVSASAMDVLVCLAQRPGELISRQELIDDVWNGDQSGESSITRCIGDLRHQLADHTDNPHYIQTLPRRGYRLLADVGAIEPAADIGPNAATPGLPVATRGSFKSFLGELRRRRVIRVGLVYLVAAWVIIQVAEVTFPILLLPVWSVTLVVILIVFGFPLALILAWAYQVESEQADQTATSVHFVVDKSRKIDFVIIAALIAAVAILTYEQYFNDRSQSPPIAAEAAKPNTVGIRNPEDFRPSIAVLPFLSLSSDPQDAYFADGLAEEILNLLVRIKEVDVAARTSSFSFRGSDVDIKTAASQLGVANILEGSIRRQGQTIRVTAQLIEAGSGFHLWSHIYEAQLEDIFSIQDDIARQVVNVLEIALSADSDSLLNRIPTESVEAYEYYLQGRDYLRDEHSETRLDSARTLFARAIGIDSNFAEAHAGLCNTYLAFYERSRSTDYFEQAERACHRGLTLDSSAGEVYTALGNLYRFSGQYAKAQAEFNEAITLNIRNVDAYNGLADTYKLQNRLDEAERTYQQAIDFQPGYWRGHLNIGIFLYDAGRVQEAILAFERATNLKPDSAAGHLNLGASYYLLGDFEKAAAAWRKSLELEPSTSAYMNVGASDFFLGRFDEAAEMYLQASELAPDDFEVWGSLGDAYRYTGNNQIPANDAYRRAIELGDRLLAINPSDALTMAALAQYLAHTGNAQRALELIGKAVRLQPQEMYVHYFSSITYASLGNKNAAIEAIEKAVELGYPAGLLDLDIGLAVIVDDHRIEALLQSSSQ